MPEPANALRTDPMHFRLAQTSKPDPAWSSTYTWVVLAILALLFISTSFGPVISDWTEGYYAGTAREMHARGDWLNPTINGFLRIEKPPLIYWILVSSTSIFGLNEFGLRLPVSLAIICWIGLIFLIMRRLAGERAGVAAALILSTMIGTRVFAEMLQPEPFLALFSTAAIWCLVEARSALLTRAAEPAGTHLGTSVSRWYWLFWVFLALGTLSKGIHGALWPLGGAILTATFFPVTRSWLRGAASVAGVGFFLLIVAPWYVYMSLRWPGFLTEHFWNEQIRTAASVRLPQINLQLPLSAGVLHQLIAMLPWSLALPAALWMAIRNRSQLRLPENEAAYLLGVTFLLEVVSLSFTSRFTYYGVSTWGWAACFFALPWRDDPAGLRGGPRVCLLLPGLGLLCAAVIYLRMGFMYAFHPPGVPVAGILESKLTALFLASPRFFSSPSLVAASVGGVLLAGAVASTWFWYRNRPFSMLVAIWFSMLGPFLLATFAFEKISPFFSLAQAAQIVNRQAVPNTNPLITWDGNPEAGSSLFVYLNMRPHYLHADFNREYAQRVLGLGRDFYLQQDDFVRIWHSSRPVFLLCDVGTWKIWQQNGLLSDRLREIYHGGDYVVITNS